MATSADDTADQLIRVLEKLTALERRRVLEYPDGLVLHPSEVHVLMSVADAPGNLTDTAALLGVTKGALSQTISRLEAKGILLKRRDPGRKNQLTAELTPRGRQVLRRCRRLRDAMRARFSGHLESLSASQVRTIADFLTHVDRSLAP